MVLPRRSVPTAGPPRVPPLTVPRPTAPPLWVSRLTVPLLAGTLIALVACGSSPPDADAAGTPPSEAGSARSPRVVTTTAILGDVTRELVGDTTRVEVLMEAGTDPHGFEPSPAQVRALHGADLVVANGLGLEESMADLLEDVGSAGVRVVRVAEEAEPLSRAGGSPDPHVWLDPVRMLTVVEVLAGELGRAIPSADGRIGQAADAYGRELRGLDRRIEAALESVPPARRRVVTTHDALGYLAARYGLEVVAVVGASHGGAAGRDLADAVAAIREAAVPAVLTGTPGSPELADAVAAEVGPEVAVVALHTDTLGPPGSGAGTYRGMMDLNARRIAQALSG